MRSACNIPSLVPRLFFPSACKKWSGNETTVEEVQWKQSDEEISNNGTCGLPEGINLMDGANTKSHHHTKLMSMTCIVCT